jgi:hypothetical protein
MKSTEQTTERLSTTQLLQQNLQTDRAKDYSKAAYASLLQRPVTEEAHRLGETLGELLFPEKTERSRGRPSDHKAAANAALAFIADILDASKGSTGRWVYRCLSAGSFTGEEFAYRPFKRAIEALKGTGLIQELPGFWTTKSAFGELQQGHGKATRWSPTGKLFELCLSLGITPENIDSHFRFKVPPRSLVLKSSSVGLGRRKEAGRPVRFPPSPQTKRIEEEVREINRSLLLHEIRNATHRGFRRIFNKGDDPLSYRWDKGGRLYSIGPDSYQVQKKELRKLITLDGQPTVEIDIRASFLTIYHALSGVSFDPTSGDPYDFAGIPRSVTKQWLVIALGAEKFPTRWSPEAGKSYRKETGRKSLGHDFPIRQIADAVLQRYPVLTGLDEVY